MIQPWHDVFDDELREIANRIQASPDDLDLFVEGICTYHMVIEGVLAMTGQHFILKYMEDHGLYPGFQQGLLAGRARRAPPHRVRRALPPGRMAQDAARFAAVIERRVCELVPSAVGVFVPPYADNARELRRATATTRRRSTATPTARSSGGWALGLECRHPRS